MLTRRNIIGIGALLSLGALSLTPALAQDTTKLAPLADGFPNRPLTLIVVDRPGTSDSIYATALVRAAEQRSPVPIKIVHRADFSTWGTWEALAWLKGQGAEENDGATMIIFPAPGIITDLLTEDMKTAIGVDLADLNPVAITEQLPYFLNQRADAPWGDTLDDMLKYAKENPGKIRYISGGPGAGQDAAMKMYMEGLDFTVDEIIGGNSSERALAVASGEGDVTVSPPDVILPHFEAGRLDVLMMSGDGASPKPWETVPSSAKYGFASDPWGTKRGLAVTAEVPEEHRKWLEDLFTAATADPEFIKTRGVIPGIQLQTLNGQETRELLQGAYDIALPIMQRLGVYWADKK